jgi:hypothetical protein
VIWFYAQDMLAWLQLDPNRSYVPLAELCVRLGLTTAKEERRLRGHAILAAQSKRMLVDTDTGELRMLCLPIELLPLWLTTLDAAQVTEPEGAVRLRLFQREAASALWQNFRPQGYDSGDMLIPRRQDQDAAEQAYVATMGMATLARHQLLIERQLNGVGAADDDDQGNDPWARRATALDDPAAARLAQTVRRVALTLAERTRRNEYAGIYSGLYRTYGITSYRRMPPARLHEALEWLERWHGDILGEPEPPPDI